MSKCAGNVMIKNVPVIAPDQSIRQVETMLLEKEASFASIDYLYVVNKEKKLVGVLSIKDLFRLPKGSSVKEVMTKRVVSAHLHTHQEKVVMLALSHNIKSIPVVDGDDTFLGVVPPDVILETAHEELTEDLLRLEGITGKDYHSLSVLRSSPLHLLRVRLPWLFLGLFGGIVAARIIGHFEGLLAEELALISFLPLMVYMSDAVGSQSQTIYIRTLAVERRFSLITYVVRELAAAVLIASVLSVLLGVIISLMHAAHLGVILGVSLFITIISSVAVAILIPALLVRLGKDPAVGSGPFATIIRDLMSIIIYFFVANLLLQIL